MPNQFLLASVFDCEQFVNCTTGARPPIAHKLCSLPGKPFMERSFSNQYSSALIRFGILRWATHRVCLLRVLLEVAGIKTSPIFKVDGTYKLMPESQSSAMRGIVAWLMACPISGAGSLVRPRPFVFSNAKTAISKNESSILVIAVKRPTLWLLRRLASIPKRRTSLKTTSEV